MAGGLYARVAARGFPSGPAYEQSGQGALESQGTTADPSHGQNSWGPPTSTLQGFSPEGPGEVQLEILELAFGSGELVAPDQTPGYGPGTFRSHAAPFPGWAGSYHDHEALQTLHENSREIHSADFGNQKLSEFTPGVPASGDPIPMHPWESNTPDQGSLTQVPLTGPQRVLGGRDAVQGYDLRNRYGFDAGHKYRPGITGNVINAYLDPAERPIRFAQGSGTYNPSDAVQGPGPWYGFNSADNVNYHDPSAYQAAPEPQTLQQPLTEAVAWGW